METADDLLHFTVSGIASSGIEGHPIVEYTNMMNSLTTYLQQSAKDFANGNATEHTYRPALKALLELR